MDSLHIQSELARMIVPPHARLSARNLPPRRHIIPAIGAVVDRMQDQSLVAFLGTQVGWGQKRVEDCHTGLPVSPPFFVQSLASQIASQTKQTLGGNGRCGAVHRLMVVVRVCGTFEMAEAG